MATLNANPIIHEVLSSLEPKPLDDDWDAQDDDDDDEEDEQQQGSSRDPFTSAEVFSMLRTINDPEHPLTLEQLSVVTLENIVVDDEKNDIEVLYTPTIPHCSMATLIGLCLRVKLLRCLPSRFKVTVKISPGSHQTEEAINKQLADKERVAAALENGHLSDLVNKCLSS
eukprot:gene5215-5746_t